MGGWGEARGPTEEERAVRHALATATSLAAAVRCWESLPSMNNQDAMLERLAEFERLLLGGGGTG